MLGEIMKQFQSVVAITKAVLDNRFMPNEPILNYINPIDREEIARRVCNGIRNKEIYVKDSKRQKYSTDKELRKYVIGMINNWFKKSKELNGGVDAKATQTSRPFPSDPAIREMRKLRSQLETAGDTDSVAAIDEQIKLRIEELNAKKEIKIDVSNIPDNLKHLVKVY